MADLEAVLADVSYLMAMEKSKSTPAARASKKIVLPDPRSVLASTCSWSVRLCVCTMPIVCQFHRSTKQNIWIIHIGWFVVKYLRLGSDIIQCDDLLICFYFVFSVRSIMHKHLTKVGEVTFDKIFNQKLGKCILLNVPSYCLCCLLTLNYHCTSSSSRLLACSVEYTRKVPNSRDYPYSVF